MSTPDTATGRERRDPVLERAIREATDGPWWVGFHAGVTEVRGRLAAARQASAPTAPAPDVGAAASARLSSAVHAIVQADPPLPRAPETHEERRAESVRSDLRTTIGHAVVLADGDARAAVATADAAPPRVPYIGEDEGSRLDVDFSNPHFGAYDAARQTVAQGAERQLANIPGPCRDGEHRRRRARGAGGLWFEHPPAPHHPVQLLQHAERVRLPLHRARLQVRRPKHQAPATTR
ncbi:hypothetical protein LO772_00035 [Yinghuangia sp. ASG 101]|nr:hypothetical protein [Yinghuangia sp. ASG 101]UGQ12043.1 hypothetical protein LO772_00035 [Yinghuangia sp. ASG 101]